MWQSPFFLCLMRRPFSLHVMTEIFFYHLTSTSLDHALPKLLEKTMQGSFRVLVKVTSTEEAERLNSWLWSYNPESFLPHGTAKDGYSEQQPIFISPEEENPNGANLIIMTCGQFLSSTGDYSRVLDIFNGEDEAQVSAARERWKNYSAQGHALSYIRQNASGSWEKQQL